jgi:hypothetical protein
MRPEKERVISRNSSRPVMLRLRRASMMSSMTTERVYDIYDGDETGCGILFHVFDIWIAIFQKAFG